MSSATATRFLHVANGTSVTRTLEAAGVPGQRSIWADPLYSGPVPTGLSDHDLVEVRSRFLGGPEASADGSSVGNAPVDPINDMRAWRDVIARRESYDALVLWFEHDLFDQLNLIQLLTWIRALDPPTPPVSLICIDRFPGRPHFKGLGELTAPELASLLDTRAPVTDAQYALAERAWFAFRQPGPEELDALRRHDTSALPFLGDAITRLLEEYPGAQDGLSRTERRLLELADEGSLTLSQLFTRMGENDRFYTITDRSLFDLIGTLTRTSPALVTLDLPEAAGQPFRGVIGLTDTGRAVLAGRVDRIEACGIDRWIGGVHLDGHTGIWRWNAEDQRIERTELQGDAPLT